MRRVREREGQREVQGREVKMGKYLQKRMEEMKKRKREKGNKEHV